MENYKISNDSYNRKYLNHFTYTTVAVYMQNIRISTKFYTFKTLWLSEP